VIVDEDLLEQLARRLVRGPPPALVDRHDPLLGLVDELVGFSSSSIPSSATSRAVITRFRTIAALAHHLGVVDDVLAGRVAVAEGV
jgi:hypothetical protein